MNATILYKFAAEALKPEPVMSVSDWADKFRMLSKKSSSEAGPWRTSRTPYLREPMEVLSAYHPAQKIVFKKGSQVGGALALETPIPTPTGWTTMGDIKVGDKVFDETGSPVSVTYKSPVFDTHDCYEFEFSDGAKIICDHVHLWQVKTNKWSESRTLSAPQIYETFKTSQGNKYFIDVNEPLKCEQKDLPIEPYQLGVWLGDGNRHTGQLYLNKADAKGILNRFHSFVVRPDSKNCVNVLVEGFCTNLREAGLLKTKKIPQEYLRASYGQRLQLLQGLMDTDGSISGNRCEYSTKDQSLYEGVAELLSSLGIKYSVYFSESMRGFSGKPLDYVSPLWRISFTCFGVEVFSLKRKLDLMNSDGRITETRRRRIVSVKKVSTVKTACISVDSRSHLYLCGKKMVTTHNTECANNWVGYIIHLAPGPTLYVMPTVALAQRQSRQKIEPMLEESPAIKERVTEHKSRDGAASTILAKDFPGGILQFAGANSASGLKNMAARYVILDELDEYPLDVEGQGDPVSLVMARTRTFSRRKMLLISTPTIDGLSKIDSEFELSDKRFYLVPCPHCDHAQQLVFKGLKWDEGKPETVKYMCESCGKCIEERYKTRMLEHGKWVATAESSTVGFHLSALYSPIGWFSWSEIVDDFIKANDELKINKKTEKMKTFMNTILGETYKESGESPEWQKLYARREQYPIGKVPVGVQFLTMGVDVQKDRIEYEIVGWGDRKESWSIEYDSFIGDTALDMSDPKSPWLKLAEKIDQDFDGPGDSKFMIRITAIDSGFNTQRVYNFCRRYGVSKVIPIKGVEHQHQTISASRTVDVRESGKTIRRGVKLFNVGVSMLKHELYAWLRFTKPDPGEAAPPGYCHFPEYGEEYFKQLTAESQMIKKDRRGHGHTEWVKERERNEALDCRIYNRAAASLVGIDRRKEPPAPVPEKKSIANENVTRQTEPEKKVVKQPDRQIRQRRERRPSDFW